MEPDANSEGGKVVRDNKEIYLKYEKRIKKERLSKPLPKHPHFGQPQPLSSEKIPTYGDLICAVLSKQSVIRLQENLKQNPSASKVATDLSDDLEEIAQMRKEDFEFDMTTKRKTELKLEVTKCFDIIERWRKRKNLSSTQEAALTEPVKLYLKDAKEKNIEFRKESPEQDETAVETSQLQESRLRDRSTMSTFNYNEGDEMSSSQASSVSSAQEWTSPAPVCTVFRMFGTKTLTNTAEALDRFQIPPNQAACLLNAFQVDTGAAGSAGERLLDPGKLERDREKVRKNKLDQQRGKIVTGLGIDGRKDKTLTRETVKVDEKVVMARNVKKKCDNVSVISTPEGEFIGHFVPESGSGNHNMVALTELLDQRGISFRPSLELVNLDGTATNTGPDLGLASQLEEELGRPLQWSICFLHHLDRPWLHLLLALDGRSLGPECFSGPIGKIIVTDVHLLPVARFQPIAVVEVC